MADPTETHAGRGRKGEVVAERDPDASARDPASRAKTPAQLIPQPEDVVDDAEGAGGRGQPRTKR